MLSALEELAALREAALITINDVNMGGVLLEDRLWAMPTRIRTVALHGVRHGATLALATAQLHSSHDLRLLEPGFPVGANEEKVELTDNFTTTVEAIVVATHAGDAILAAFFEP